MFPELHGFVLRVAHIYMCEGSIMKGEEKSSTQMKFQTFYLLLLYSRGFTVFYTPEFCVKISFEKSGCLKKR